MEEGQVVEVHNNFLALQASIANAHTTFLNLVGNGSALSGAPAGTEDQKSAALVGVYTFPAEDAPAEENTPPLTATTAEMTEEERKRARKARLLEVQMTLDKLKIERKPGMALTTLEKLLADAKKSPIGVGEDSSEAPFDANPTEASSAGDNGEKVKDEGARVEVKDEDVRAVLLQYAKKHGDVKALKLMQKIGDGASNITDFPSEKYGDFILAMKEGL